MSIQSPDLFIVQSLSIPGDKEPNCISIHVQRMFPCLNVNNFSVPAGIQTSELPFPLYEPKLMNSVRPV